MSLTISLDDFVTDVEKLDANGTNWVTFYGQFITAARQMGVYEHFVGSNPRPSLANEDAASSAEKRTYAKELAMWDRNENLALYMLSLKLPDTIFVKFINVLLVTKVWAGLVEEIKKKLLRMQSNLRSEFMNMRYKLGADLREQLDRVRLNYEALIKVDVSVSDDDYRSLVINFLSPELSSFVTRFSVDKKALMMTNGSSSASATGESWSADRASDAEALMRMAVDEWDRCKAENELASKGMVMDMNTDLVTVLAEEPVKGSGGRKSRKRGKPVCWNCGDRGHNRGACPNPNIAVSNEERSMGTCQSDSDKSEWKAPGGSHSGSSSERSRSRSRDPDVSAAPLEEDSNDAGGMSALAIAIEAVIELNAYEDIDEVDEADFVEILTECDPDEGDIAGLVVFPSNSSLPPCNPRLKRRDRADVEESHEDEPKGNIVIIPTEPKIEEVDVPKESGFLDDSSASHHVLICREEAVSAVVEELLKPSEVMDALEGRVNLDAGRWDSPNSGLADELEAGSVRLQARMLDSGGASSAVCVLMIAAVVIGMEKELNGEKKDAEQHTLKDPTTDARVIMEGVRSIAFDTEACSGDAVDDPGGSFIEEVPSAWINDENREISENFTFDEERDLPVADSFVDESRGSNGHRGLNPEDGSLDIADEDGDVGWNWSRRCMDRVSRLRKLMLMMDITVGWIGKKAWISKVKKAPDRLGPNTRVWSDLWAWLPVLLVVDFLLGTVSAGLRSIPVIKEGEEERTCIVFNIQVPLGWPDFIVALLYSFIVDPGPYLFENGCFGSFETFASTAKRTYLEAFDVECCTPCGTRFSGRGIRAGDVGEERIILMPLEIQPVALIGYRAHGGLKTYLQETSDSDRYAADEDILRDVAREFGFPVLFS